jgi:bis(5'-nucleosidyl)-tetraphosphatase
MSDQLTAFSCGVFVMRRKHGKIEFLLMRHADRLDFAKGHIEEGESEMDCALRELREETGISTDQIHIESNFRYTVSYVARYKRFDYQPVTKTLVLYLGWVSGDTEPEVSEHAGYEWYQWNPPHKIQEQAIDPVLQYVENYFLTREDRIQQ